MGLLTAVALAALSGCGASEAIDSPAAPAVAGDGKTEYPLVVSNCGSEQTFEAAPQRVVSLD